MTVAINSAFRWRENPRPSIFASDPLFMANRTGKTRNQISSESVDRITAATGKNPGSIRRISSHGDALIEQAEYQRRAQRGQGGNDGR